MTSWDLDYLLNPEGTSLSQLVERLLIFDCVLANSEHLQGDREAEADAKTQTNDIFTPDSSENKGTFYTEGHILLNNMLKTKKKPPSKSQ